MPDAQELWLEYEQLDSQYRQLAEKLKPFPVTTNNLADYRQLHNLVLTLESTLRQLNEKIGQRLSD